MGHFLTIPHRRARGMCPVNGIRDLIQWRSDRDWSNEFVHGLGQGGGFAYLRFGSANPPRQVYWGIASPRQHKYLAQLLGADYSEYENRAFKFSWSKARGAVDAVTPPVLGPLDMFHLPFYPELYQRCHVPIHFLLLVGYDDERAYVHDTDQEAVQTLSLSELESAWNVNVLGLGKRNRLAILVVPRNLASTEDLIRTSILDQCQTMLSPPVSVVGIPAMEKVAREIAQWPQELGKDAANMCLRQVCEYLNSPPDIMGTHRTAGRDLYLAFLQEAAEMAGLDFSRAVDRFREVIGTIPSLVEAIQQGHLTDAAAFFSGIAKLEREAYTELGRVVGGKLMGR